MPACLFATWGEDRAKQFFRDLKANAQVLSGNRQVARAVGTGQLAFGLTDTDDAMIEKESGRPVEIVYPDQAEGELGVLLIPNTLAIVKGAPHREAAERLVDYLLSPEVEERLATGPSAQIPLNPAVKLPGATADTPGAIADTPGATAGLSSSVERSEASTAGRASSATQPRVMPISELCVMKVDFEKAAASWDTAAEFLRKEFATAE